MTRDIQVAFGACFILALTTATASGQCFQGLGGAPSWANGVSADGTVVVGISGTEAFRWTQAGGMVGLGGVSAASAVSADGFTVVGTGHCGLVWEAFRWTQAGGMVCLGDLLGSPAPAETIVSQAAAVSANGSVVVGYSASESMSGTSEAFRWTQAGGMDGLGELAGGDVGSVANGVSANGSVVVGYSASASGYEAFRWTQAGGMDGLGGAPSMADAVSADGTVVVGTSALYSGVFRWTQGDGMLGLGMDGLKVYNVSADGSVIVAGMIWDVPPGYNTAYYWTEETGWVSLYDLLVDTYGLDLTGWTLSAATDVSDDGQTIVGIGFNPSGQYEAWIACLAPPAWTVLVFLNGDNNLEGPALDDFNEMEMPDNVRSANLVVCWDQREDGDSAYYKVKHDTDPGQLATYTEGVDVFSQGELNMGAPSTLTDFTGWAIENYPAEHYLLVIWNHGAGWGPRGGRGISWDEHIPGAPGEEDFFTTNEIRDAVATVATQIGENLDILGMDACLMQMVEVAYSARESCDYVVASEEWEPSDGWAYDDFLGAIQADTDPFDLSVAIVDAYQAQHGQTYPTLSAFAAAGMDDLATKVDLLAEALMLNMNTEALNVADARHTPELVAFDYDNPGPEPPDNDNANSYVDLGQLCQILETECEAQEIKDAANNVTSALLATRIANKTNGAYYSPAEGLSIYFPDHQPDMVNGDDYYANYQNEGGSPANLDFVADTSWDEFLRLYCEKGDDDFDGDFDLLDVAALMLCFSGDQNPATARCAFTLDFDGDNDVDLEDCMHFAGVMGGPNP